MVQGPGRRGQGPGMGVSAGRSCVKIRLSSLAGRGGDMQGGGGGGRGRKILLEISEGQWEHDEYLDRLRRTSRPGGVSE